MTWPQVEQAAQAGMPVRRASWPATRTLLFSRGAGTTLAVAVLRNGATENVLRSTDFTVMEYAADDWRIAI